ncbi:hypothetical protein B0H14DRAFT_2595346 [Mycena olivaceomarginata]|nr:hypothetical protein B0H14DRAFT_2595346 [Mycena olivaceomarginata]
MNKADDHSIPLTHLLNNIMSSCSTKFHGSLTSHIATLQIEILALLWGGWSHEQGCSTGTTDSKLTPLVSPEQCYKYMFPVHCPVSSRHHKDTFSDSVMHMSLLPLAISNMPEDCQHLD